MGRRATPLAVVWVLLVAALGLGVIGVPRAGASCVGPQLRLEQRGASIDPRPVGPGTDRSVFDVRAGQTLQVDGSNLTDVCHDTYAEPGPGCRGPSQPPDRPTPIRNAELVLTQSGHRWTLVPVVPIDADLRTRLNVALPAGLARGPARLSLQAPDQGGVQLDLMIT